MKHIEFLKKCQNHWTLLYSVHCTVYSNSSLESLNAIPNI
jgi:hypothetical protein